MFLVTLMAASIAGVAFAHWSDVIYIEGTVEMGELIVGWLDIKFCGDNEDTFDPVKEVAEPDCWLEVPETSVHHEPPQTVYKELHINVTNAYPQYEAFCKVDLKNAGTIPAHIVGLSITDPDGVLTIEQDPLDPTHYEILKDVDGDGNLEAIINLYIYKQATGDPLVCNQLEPCTDEPVDIVLEFKQEAEECHTYRFSIEILAVQWNKAYLFLP
jgi:hypothetical protein